MESNSELKNEASKQSERKAKSCKGFLYYSSSNSKNPTCIGISQTLQKFPSLAAGKAELNASNRGSNLTNFCYICLGHSIYLDKNNSLPDSENQVPKLPICIFGLEMLMNEKPSDSTVPTPNVPAHKPNEHEPTTTTTTQPQISNSSHVRGGEFFNRFKRNAGLVASGVAKNLKRVGNYARETVDGILNPERRRPK